jgi:hypothetical protein
MSANFIRVVEKKGEGKGGKMKSLLTFFHYKFQIQSLNQGLCKALETGQGWGGDRVKIIPALSHVFLAFKETSLHMALEFTC